MRLPKNVIEEIMEEDLEVNSPEEADPDEGPDGAAAPLDASDGPGLHSLAHKVRTANLWIV
jgi:hypothetical protein